MEFTKTILNGVRDWIDDNYISSNEQTFTEEEKIQARKNIGAVSTEDHVHSWNSLPDKPFGETVGDTLTWDGNTEGLVSANVYLYKISDATPANDEIQRASFAYTDGVYVYAGNISDLLEGQTIYEEKYAVAPYGEAALVFVVREPGDIAINDSKTWTFSETGVYFSNINSIYVSRLTIPDYTGFRVIEKLDEKFLPESVDGVVVRSSTVDSTKLFKITVDDTGAITATEVT